MNFKNWLNFTETTLGTEDVDASQIESLYGKARQSVELAREYDETMPPDQQVLRDVSTIANLATGAAYGIFMSGETSKAIGQDVTNNLKLIYPNDPMLGRKVQKLPKATILKTLQQKNVNVNAKDIMPSDVIRVDIRRHLAKYGDTPAAVIEIASTIIHEATHVKQFEDEGHTEDGAGTRVEQAEAAFKNWVKLNWMRLSQKFGFQGNYPFI